MKINVYMMNDCDWYAREKAGDCLNEICEDMGCSMEQYIKDYDYVEPFSLTDEEMDKFQYTYISSKGDKITTSFKVELNKMIQEGVEFPIFFASTEY